MDNKIYKMSWIISIGIVIGILLLLGVWGNLIEEYPETTGAIHTLAAIAFFVWLIHLLITKL